MTEPTPTPVTAPDGDKKPNPEAPQRPLLKLALEIGPLVVFFISNSQWGIFTATAAFMVAIAIALPLAWKIERRLPIMPLVTGAFVLVFGGLTLYLHDETFIKLKPTIVNLLFAAILFGGLFFRTALLKPLFGPVFQLSETGWRILTLRWAAFFILLAVLNEIVWRTQTTEFWIQFKLFGIMPLTLVFSMLQLRLISRHPPESDAA